MNYLQHSLSALFPAQSKDEFDELKTSIKINGQLNSIWVVPFNDDTSYIIDGWHRYKACEELGKKPIFSTYKGQDIIRFVIAQNLNRRHLTTSQKAMIGAQITNSAVTTAKEVSKVMNVSEREIHYAKKVINTQPEKVDNIVNGKETIHKVLNADKENKIKLEPLENKEDNLVELYEQALNTIDEKNIIIDELKIAVNTNDKSKKIAELANQLRIEKNQKNLYIKKNAELGKNVAYYQSIVNKSSKLLNCEISYINPNIIELQRNTKS